MGTERAGSGRNGRTLILVGLLALGSAWLPRSAEAEILDDVPVPPGFVLNPSAEVTPFNVQVFHVGARDVSVEGRHAVFAAHAEPARELDAAKTYALWRATLEHAGWKIAQPPPEMVARKTVRSTELWLHVSIFDSSDCRFQLVAKGPRATSLTLEAPTGDASLTAAGQDFPFLKHFPGTHFTADYNEGMLDVTPPGDPESRLVGPMVGRQYASDASFAPHEVLGVYQDALTKVGWTILRREEPSDGVLVAHYGKNGHDVWLNVHAGNHDLVMQVADVGAANAAAKLAAELKRKGHVAVYGIYFDTDSARLKPESDGTLKQILAVLQADAALKLEIQGHTDSTGDRSHNQTLSESRAASVRAWLLAAHAAPARLTTTGLADTKPVADNERPEGRALNRRVELVRKSPP